MKLRSYQKTIIKAQREFMANNDLQRGQIYSPTGSGKTVCFDALITDLLKSKTKKKICIVYPRIALAIDQQARLKDKRNVEFTSFHSGGNDAPDEAKQYRKQISTTSVEVLQEVINTTDRHHITFSSYHSFEQICELDFDLIICDEGHNMVQNNFSKSLPKIKSKVIFYTATPINIINGLETVVGMNNENLFGPVICDIKPKTLIDRGYIVAPLLVELNISTDENGITVQPHLAIAHAYNDQKSRLQKVNNKMLVAMSDTKFFDDIQDKSHEINDMVGEVDIYTITAGTQCKNGTQLPSREAALEDFGKNTNQCIILHCDTLAEGIDVPGITGVFIYRTLSKSKLIQTIGRAARPSLLDMDKNGEIIDMNNRVKPHAILTVAVIDNEYYANLNTKTCCEAFIEGGYGDSISDITQFISKERVECQTGENSGKGNNLTTQQSLLFKHIESVEADQVKLDLEDEWDEWEE